MAHRVDFALATAVVIYDISAGGLGIISPDRHAVDELLMVEWRHGFLVGRVRHVKETSVGFFIGVQLEELKAHRLLIAEICQAALTGLYAGAGSPSDKNEDREPHHQYNLPAEPASLP